MRTLLIALFLFVLMTSNAVAGFVLTGTVGKMDAMLKMERTDSDEAKFCILRNGILRDAIIVEVKMEWYRFNPYIVVQPLMGDTNEYIFQPDDVSYTRFKDLKAKGE